ncbi:Protein of unknown function, partial [Gryllus bimaculatus]
MEKTGEHPLDLRCVQFNIYTAADGCSSCVCTIDSRMTYCSRDACPEPRGGSLHTSETFDERKFQTIAQFKEMTFYSGSYDFYVQRDPVMKGNACCAAGNYSNSECVEGATYQASDGCNSCQCNEWRRFATCTRNVCPEMEEVLAAAPPPPPTTAAPPALSTPAPPYLPPPSSL